MSEMQLLCFVDRQLHVLQSSAKNSSIDRRPALKMLLKNLIWILNNITLELWNSSNYLTL